MAELKGHLKALAVKKALQECIRSLDIKKVLPPSLDLPFYKNMPVTLFSWNSGLDRQRRRTSMVQHNILLKRVSLKSLEQQKTAVDYKELILALENILFNFEQKQKLNEVLQIFAFVEESLQTLDRLKKQSKTLQEVRQTKLNEELTTLDFRSQRTPKTEAEVFLENTLHPMAGLIESDFRKKYYKQSRINIDEKFELERNVIQKQIDDLEMEIKKEIFCGEQIAMTYREQTYYYTYRYDKLSKKFDEERTKKEDEIAAKQLEIKSLRSLTESLKAQMIYYRQKIEEILEKLAFEDRKEQQEFVQKPIDPPLVISQARLELQKMMRQEKKKKRIPKPPKEEKFKEVPVYEGESKLDGLKELLNKKYRTNIKKVIQKKAEGQKILKKAMKVLKNP